MKVFFHFWIISFAYCLTAAAQPNKGGPPPPPPPPPPSSEDTGAFFNSLSVEQQPEFPGGQKELYAFISKNITYPQIEKENGIQGKVYIQFVIETDGSVSNVKVLKGVKGGPGLEKEAMRVVKMMPKWTPGMLSGKKVRVMFNLPFSFKLDGGADPPIVKSDDQPQFPGGDEALRSYLKTNMIYPKKAKKKKKEGMVIVSCIISIAGNVSDVKISFSTDPIFNDEAMRLVTTMPKWIPGKEQKSGSLRSVSINFKLKE